ncbi:MAG: hypothetical protein JWN98_2719 [Abditibacteriota bacterium]|nr:hypothetical protein [Abditibacteriota bacterium]
MRFLSRFSVLLSIIPSTRLAAYFGFGALLWVVAALLPSFVVVAALYDLVLVFVALLDLVLSPQPREWEVERHVEGKMNLGAPNTVELQARFRGARGLAHAVRIVVRDEPPVEWPVEWDGEPDAASLIARAPLAEGLPAEALPVVARLTLEVPSGETPAVCRAAKSYRVTPTRRGDFRFGPLSARYPTFLGFWYRQLRREAEQAVRVYPDTEAVRRYELRLRQGRLQDMGLHLLRLRGRGTEFESLRDYSRDDEYKAINWKASARRGKLIATNYEIERDQTMLIAIDCGRMMTSLAVAREFKAQTRHTLSPAHSLSQALGQSTLNSMATLEAEEEVAVAGSEVALSKLDCAINAAVLLAHVGAGMGDAVGLLLFADGIKAFVPPRKGRAQTGTIIEALYAAQPQLVEPDYRGAYQYLMSRRLRRSLVITFTDVIDPFASRELINASGALRRHHNALCVTINNRDVMDMASHLPQAMPELYEKAMAQRMLQQRGQALETLRQNGVGVLDVEASELTIATVNRYLDLKSRAAL